MGNNEIKKYIPIVWVEVLRSYVWENGRTVYDNEYLYWDGEIEDFANRRANATYIVFHRYNKRHVPTSKIQDFWLQEVPEVQKVEEEKPVEFNFMQRIKKDLIYRKHKISKIVFDSFTEIEK